MNYFLGRNFAEEELRNRPRDQRNDPIMVGDLPLKRQGYLLTVLDAENPPAPDRWGNPTSSWNHPNYGKACRLESFQVYLHLEGQKTKTIVVEGHYSNASFHEEIRAHWEQFARVVGENDQLEEFTMKNLTLPPAPFFADKMAPSLEKSSLIRLDLNGCKLGASEIEGVAEILKQAPSLVSVSLAY